MLSSNVLEDQWYILFTRQCNWIILLKSVLLNMAGDTDLNTVLLNMPQETMDIKRFHEEDQS